MATRRQQVVFEDPADELIRQNAAAADQQAAIIAQAAAQQDPALDPDGNAPSPEAPGAPPEPAQPSEGPLSDLSPDFTPPPDPNPAEGEHQDTTEHAVHGAFADSEAGPAPGDPKTYSQMINENARKRAAAIAATEGGVPLEALSGEILPPTGPGEIIRGDTVVYKQRVKVLEAYQYKGQLATAPNWVDRNWAAFGDYDPMRQIQPGPAVRVPDDMGGAVMARIGDYIVQEEVTVSAEPPITDVRVSVWAKESFEKFFIRV